MRRLFAILFVALFAVTLLSRVSFAADYGDWDNYDSYGNYNTGEPDSAFVRARDREQALAGPPEQVSIPELSLSLYLDGVVPSGFSITVYDGSRQHTGGPVWGLNAVYTDKATKEKFDLYLSFSNRKATLSSRNPSLEIATLALSDQCIRLLCIQAGLKPDQYESRYDPPLASSGPREVRVQAINYRNVALWHPATGKELRTLAGHSAWVYSVAFSPDGRNLASGSYDKTIRLWDTATGKELRTFVGHSEGVSSVAFSPDGRTLATGSGDKTIKLWDTATVATPATATTASPVSVAPETSPEGQSKKGPDVSAGYAVSSEPTQIIGEGVYEGTISNVDFNFQLGGGGAGVTEVYVWLKELPLRRFVFTPGLATKSGLMTLNDLGGGFVQGPYLQGKGWKVRIRVVPGSHNVSAFEKLSEVATATTSTEVGAGSDGIVPPAPTRTSLPPAIRPATEKTGNTQPVLARPKQNTGSNVTITRRPGPLTVAPLDWPERAAKRQEIFSVVVRTFRLESAYVNPGFSDLPQDHWCSQAVSTLWSAGVISGLPDGRLHLNAPMTRVEWAMLLAELCDRLESMGLVRFANTSENRPFPDVSEAHYAYNAILKVRKVFSPPDRVRFAGSLLLTRSELEGDLRRLIQLVRQ